MIEFDADIFTEWQTDYESFNHAFRYYCFMQFRAYSVEAEFVPNVTRQIHSDWLQDCKDWLRKEVHPETTKLSQLKKACLLLYNLSKNPFLGNMRDYEYKETPKFLFRGSQEQYDASRLDLIDLRETILSLDFCINIMVYFEMNRDDRTEDYRDPLTVDMRHDIINYFISGQTDRKAIYLIFKALFLRKGGAPN